MIGKSVKTKRRRQAAEADRILDALFDAAQFEDTQLGSGNWPTCHALNIRAGIALLPALASILARFPQGQARLDACWAFGGDSYVIEALGGSTPDRVLEKAGLL